MKKKNLSLKMKKMLWKKNWKNLANNQKNLVKIILKFYTCLEIIK